MKKSLTIAGAALAVALGLTSCGDTTANTSTDTTVPGKFGDSAPGTVEDRRAPITVSPNITAPTTSTTSDQFPDTGPYATPAILDGDPVVMEAMDDLLAALEAFGDTAADDFGVRYLYQIQDAADKLYDSVSGYTGPLAAAIQDVAVTEYVAAGYGIEGDWDMCAFAFGEAGDEWNAILAEWS